MIKGNAGEMPSRSPQNNLDLTDLIYAVDLAEDLATKIGTYGAFQVTQRIIHQ